ncbi:cadmium-translocating P-type ATPase [Fictibacillus sp. S7]|nr:cadmium-translocating P-type ATPase [Fictibacillus sp. S7]
MVTDQQREFLLDGLDCANCASKIEDGVRELEGVSSCSVNFVTKTLRMETEQGRDIPVIENTRDLIQSIEPHIKVLDQPNTRQNSSMSFYMEGLDCANCAAKIEKEAAGLTGVSLSSMDFVSKTLRIKTDPSTREKDLSAKIVEIVKRLEPGVKVTQQPRHINSEPSQNNGNKNAVMLTRIGMGAVLTAVAAFAPLNYWLEFSLFLVAYLIIGGEILLKAVRNIVRGQVFDENFLMSLATVGAFAVGQFPEGVAVMLFYQVGEWFQSLAVNRSRKSIRALMDIRPDYANRKVGSRTERVSPDDVRISDIIIIKPGEKVPLDGKIVEGVSMVDTSALTGESVPRKVKPGSDLLSGTINKNGVLTVEVTKKFEDSTVSKILDLVQNASSKKAPTENFITKFARYYTPVVVITAAVLAFLPPLLIQSASFSEWIYRALVFLVISCPCALVVSIPLSFFGGVGGASKTGILIKGSNYLEALNDVKYVLFDKTGTLTKGVFDVTRIHSDNGFSSDELLYYAAMAEAHSNHPIAFSVRSAFGKEIQADQVGEYNEISGYGIRATVDGKEVLAGNEKLMNQEKIAYEKHEAEGTVVHVAVNRTYAGHLVISDEVKEDAASAIAQLKELGIKKTVMLTGDSKAVGERVGHQLGLDEVHAELLPHEKVEQVEKWDGNKSKNEKLIFVGDGINDTPVLARADIGMAMGGLGSDAAIEAADVVIMTDEPSKIPEAIKIAKRTRKIVWQNIIFALGVKAVFLSLGAFGIATMWEAVFSDVGVTLIAVLNAMRVLNVKTRA